MLWSGRSVRPGRWNLADTVCVAVLLFGLGFAGYWQYQAQHTPTAFRLLGLLVPLALVVSIGRYFVGRRRPRDRYVLTDRRLLTVTRSGVRSDAVEDLEPPVIGQLDADGVGTIVFGSRRLVDQLPAALNQWQGPLSRARSFSRSPTPSRCCGLC